MNSQKSNTLVFLLLHVVIATIVALLASEIVMQLLDKPKPIISGWLKCEKHSEECNDMGFRGRKFAYSDDDFVVILLGDSEIYAPKIPFEQMPENRLEHYLKKYHDKVKVFSVADMGYGQDQQYLALKEYFKDYRADLVLLRFTVRNDVEDNIYPTSGFNNTIKPTFWLKDGKLLGPTEGWLEQVGPRSKLGLLWSIHVGKAMGRARLEKWRNEILPPYYQGLEHYEGEVDYSWQKMWGDSQEEYKSYEYERVGHSGNELTPRSELRMYGIDLTRRLLTQINELIETNNGRFIIFKEERPWEVQDLDKERVYILNDKYYKLSTKQSRETLNDLFRGFENYTLPLGLKEYTLSKEDEHLNAVAIDKLMKEMSVVISKKEYFK